MDEKKCMECGKVLFGRSDKKFCDDSCRNAHNNRSISEANTLIRKTILVLKKNRRILEKLYLSNKRKTTLRVLLEKGYDYNRLTHIYVNKKNQTYRFCFDYGFVEYEDGWVFLVEDKTNGIEQG